MNKKEKEQEIYSRHKPSCERGTGMANIYEYVYVKTIGIKSQRKFHLLLFVSFNLRTTIAKPGVIVIKE